MTKVKMHTAEFVRDLKNNVMRKKMIAIGEMIAADAVRRCIVGKYPDSPQVGGQTKGSIHSKMQSNDTVHVMATTDWALPLEMGTPPHKIKAKNKPYLRFKINGKWVTKKEVNHPGTKRQPYLRPALWENRRKIEEILSRKTK